MKPVYILVKGGHPHTEVPEELPPWYDLIPQEHAFGKSWQRVEPVVADEEYREIFNQTLIQAQIDGWSVVDGLYQVRQGLMHLLVPVDSWSTR